MKPSFLIAGIGLALAIIFGLQYWQRQESPPEPEPVAIEPAPSESLAPVTPGEPPVLVTTDAQTQDEPPLPILDESDGFVRELLEPQALSGAWLEPEQLLRRVATLLDNAAVGSFPKRQLAFLAPEGDFAVIRAGKLYRIDPKSYARFDAVVSVLETFEAQTMADIYRRVEPLLTKALAELGQAQSPDLLLAKAIAVVAQIPQLDDEVRLVRPDVLYRYQDPTLEKLSPLQKQVLRMGPDNVARIQGYLVELAEVLALEAPTPE